MSAPSEHALSPEQRGHVLVSIYKALRAAHPALFEQDEVPFVGGIDQMHLRIDDLVALVRRPSADCVEPFVDQLLDTMCLGGPRQEPAGNWPRRQLRACVFQRDTTLILHAVAAALSDIADTEYHFNHPTGTRA